jgi:hypothetical protein
MTHDSDSHDGHPGHSLEGLADIDDLMRQLSDFITFPLLCRRAACRRAWRCQGGAGPPCLHECPGVFAANMQNGLRDARRFWKRQRAMAAQRDARAKGRA